VGYPQGVTVVEEIDTRLEGRYKECACRFDDFLLLSSEDTIKRTHAAAGMSECPSHRQPREMYQGELAHYIKLAKQRNLEKLDLLLFQFAKAGKST
jgi:hypothetical protein